MSKLPMETRPLRLSPQMAGILEDRLRPLSGKKLAAAQEAVLRVYRSGMQAEFSVWVAEYLKAIDAAVKDQEKVAA